LTLLPIDSRDPNLHRETTRLLALLGRNGELMGEAGDDAFGLLGSAGVKDQEKMRRRLTAMALECCPEDARGQFRRPEVRAS
jgi:hypothetical protein